MDLLHRLSALLLTQGRVHAPEEQQPHCQGPHQAAPGTLVSIRIPRGHREESAAILTGSNCFIQAN